MLFYDNTRSIPCFIILEKNCSVLPAPVNGIVTYSPAGDTTCGSNATYSCNVGYQLSTSGDETRYCGEDALWNGTAKNCSSKHYTRLSRAKVIGNSNCQISKMSSQGHQLTPTL